MINEHDLNNVNKTTPTYAIKPVDKFASENTSFLENKFNYEVIDINEKLPNMYWNANCHTQVFTENNFEIYNQIEHSIFKIQNCSGVKTFRSVQNNQTVIDAIDEINS